METLTEKERRYLALALQGLLKRQPQATEDLLVLADKLDCRTFIDKYLTSWISSVDTSLTEWRKEER